MSSIQISGVRKSFGTVEVIKGIDLEIEEGTFVIFVGPSGCGKSTLLRLVSGLEEVSDGSILIDGEDVTGKRPAERGLSMVFQSYALYPHKTVRQNMGFGLQVARTPKAVIDQKVEAAAAVLKLEDLLHRRPKELSGGQRQRVAIGRSIVREPRAFLFDEPLSNLDAALRVDMRLEIAKLHQHLSATMIYVTHDQVEAMTLADRIVVLQDGLIEQVGSPMELYENPANLFVAQFIGSPKMNVADCQTSGGNLLFPNNVTAAVGQVPDGVVSCGARPEHITIVAPEESDLSGVIDVIEYLGSDTFAYVKVEGVGLITIRIVGFSDLKAGQTAGILFDRKQLHLFAADGRAINWR